MNLKRINLDKPVMTFYEEGDWLRIECPLWPTRYIPKDVAVRILRDYGVNSFPEKPFLIVK